MAVFRDLASMERLTAGAGRILTGRTGIGVVVASLVLSSLVAVSNDPADASVGADTASAATVLGSVLPGDGFNQVALATDPVPRRTTNPELLKPGWPVGERAVSDAKRLVSAGVVRVEFGDDQLVSGARLETEVLDRAMADKLSPVSAAIRVGFVDDRSLRDPSSSVEFAFDVSDLAFLAGGDLRERLKVVVHTGCVEESSGALSCSASEPVPTGRNSLGEITAVVSGDLLTGGGIRAVSVDRFPPGLVDSAVVEQADVGFTVIAMSSSASSALGSYSATPFAPLASYQVGLFSGAAETSYPIPVPPAAAGTAPSVVLRYSSGGVDGMNGSRNAQASKVGLGWDYSPGFISMTLPECDSGTHLCWVPDPVYMLNLNGVRSRLIQESPGSSIYHPQADPLWKVERVSGGTTPDAGDVFWQVTTNDGTTFRFGGEIEPLTGDDQDSAFFVPVSGAPECSTSVCDKTYQWNLDWVEDPNGNATSFFYTQETNLYELGRDYVRAGFVERIEYTKRSGSPQANAKVRFELEKRCSGACAWPQDYPDTPLDLGCLGSPCPETVPTFWSDYMLTAIETEVYESGAWNQVSRFELAQSFPEPGNDPEGDTSDPKLWLDSITRKGANGGVLGEVTFGWKMLDNRVNYNGNGVAPMRMPRLEVIDTELGGKVTFAYSAPAVGSAACGTVATWADQSTMCFPEYDPYTGNGGSVIWNKYRVESQTNTDPNVAGTPTESWTYAYETPAWHITDFDFRDVQYHSDFRGFKKVTVTDGSGNENESLFFQGMDGDARGSSTKSVSVTNSSGTSYTDSNWLAGQVLEAGAFDPQGTALQRTRYTYDAVVTATESGLVPDQAPVRSDVVPFVGDWDGNGTSDVGYFRKDTQTFYGPFGIPTPFGNPEDEPYIGDWDGDGTDDIGVYRSSTLRFYLLSNIGEAPTEFFIGNDEDLRLIADWDGDGDDEPVVYRSSNARFYRWSGDTGIPFGDPGDDGPLVGDWSGNGTDEFGLYRDVVVPEFHLLHTNGTVTAPSPMGSSGDIPLVVDWSGDGKDLVAQYRGSTAAFYIVTDPATSNPDVTVDFGDAGDDAPLIGNWDGVGGDEVGVYRWKENRFYVLNSDGTTTSSSFGAWGDSSERSARFVTARTIETMSFGAAFAPDRTTKTEYEYDAQGNLEFETRYGDTASSLDDRTVVYEYYPGPGQMVDRLSNMTLWEGTSGFTPGNELAYMEYGYDAAMAAPTSRGNLTRVRTWLDRTTGGGGTFTDATFGYDSSGRQTTATDGEGNVTTTTYNALFGYPETVTNELLHTTTMTVDPKWGIVRSSEDPNGNVTNLYYDQHGRLTEVVLPGDLFANPTASYTYTIPPSGPAKTTTTAKIAGGTVTSVSYVDGFGRVIQSQVPSPGSATSRTLVTSRLDASGRPDRVSEPYQVSGNAGDGYVPLTSWNSVLHTRTAYNPKSETVSEIYNGATPLTSSTVQNDGWQSKVVDGEGNQTRSFTDAFGNLVKVDEYNGASLYATTNYGYDKQGNLVSVTDDASNVTTIGYDLAGRKTSMTDPDLGSWAYGYDDVGNLTSQTDGRSQSLYFTYDDLNRMETKEADSSGGALLAEWFYDATGFRGLPSSSKAYEAAGIVEVTYDAYDARNNLVAKSWTVPGAAGGDFAMAWSYGPDGQVATTTYPGGNDGSLGETVTTGYSNDGLPETLTGTDTYVDSTTFNEWGGVESQQLGSGATTLDRVFGYDAQRRVDVMSATRPGTGTVFDYRLGYDDNNNVTSVLDVVNASQRQCLSYDALDRLSDAFTTGAGSCGGSPDTGVGVGGFDYSYTYDSIGNLKTNSALSGTYSYGAGSAGPHAVTGIGSGFSFGYDANGNQTTRAVPGVSQALVWDESNRLASVSEGSDSSTFTYDADGVRVTRSVTDAGSSGGGVWQGDVTVLEAGTDPVNANNPYSTAVLSPPSDATLLACFTIRNDGETPVVTISDTFSGGSLAWSEVSAIHHDTGGTNSWAYCYSASTGATPGSGTVTVGSVGTSNFGMHWQILAITGTDLTGGDGVVGVSSAVDPSGSSSITVNTGPWGDPDNVGVGYSSIQEGNATTFTPDYGWSFLDGTGASWGTNSESEQTATMWREGEDTSVVADWGSESGPIGMMIIELATTATGSGGGGSGGGGSSGSVDVTVGSSGDDVYVSSSGSFSSSSGNLWYGRWNNGTTVVEESMYARFGGVSVPFGATITDAYVTFTLDNNYASSDMLATVRLQDSDDAVAPTSYSGFQGASRTGVVSVWLMQSSWSGDPTVQSGDLSALVQEVVDRPGWVSGSAMGVFVEDPTSGSGTNDWGFYSYDKDPAKAPRLVIEYTVGGTGGGGAVVSDSVYIGGVYESTVTDTTTSEALYYSLAGDMVASRTDGIVEWMLLDQLGSPNTIIDAATGATTRRLFDPFGTVRFDDGVETDRSFTGQYGDPSTGLLFYNARYYDPLIGRFVSPDSIVPDPSNPQDLNRYSYARNNPASYTDPTGNDPCPNGAGGCGGVRQGDTDGNGIVCGGWAGCESSPPWSPPDRSGRSQSFGEFVESPVLGFIPVVGEAIDAYYCGRSSMGGAIGGTAVDCGSLFVPFVGGRFLRKAGRTVDGWLRSLFGKAATRSIPGISDDLLQQADDVARRVDRGLDPPPGVRPNGRQFMNDSRGGSQVLPALTADGTSIRYREWDVNPSGPAGRDGVRVVTGSDGSAWFTGDHYNTFTQIRLGS